MIKSIVLIGVIITLVASSTIREKRQNEPDSVDERYAFGNQQQGGPNFNNDGRQGIFGHGNFGQGSLFGQGNSGQENFGQGNFGQGNFGQGNTGQGNSGQTNPAGTTTTTAAPPGAPAPTANTSPQFLRCTANCQTTNQYNPVCGSDRQLYNNRARLDCANLCGANITLLKMGICPPAT